VDLLIRSNDQRWIVSKTITELRLPMVCARLTIKEQKDDLQLMVASIHLEPHSQGMPIRKRQFKRIIELSENNSCPMLIIGDTNMRDDEDEHAEERAVDLWKAAGQDVASRYTKDTVDHTRSDPNGWHNRYYGKNYRHKQRRYDRMYWRPDGGATLDKVTSFGLIADKPICSPYHFLSDHFGIFSEICIEWTKSNNENRKRIKTL
jgi:endonuclease/exonuclease/phosphatase family metal-dependent hydrolase